MDEVTRDRHCTEDYELYIDAVFQSVPCEDNDFVETHNGDQLPLPCRARRVVAVERAPPGLAEKRTP
ncbi:hypothetical protein ColKHC_01536 [Colletotrichum higginsianum]|nr:hypothetical protein ColKHC_01536 [Colletotrichum higginsianum]